MSASRALHAVPLHCGFACVMRALVVLAAATVVAAPGSLLAVRGASRAPRMQPDLHHGLPTAAESLAGRWRLLAAEDLGPGGSVARHPWGAHLVGSIVVESGSCYLQIMSTDVPSF